MNIFIPKGTAIMVVSTNHHNLAQKQTNSDITRRVVSGNFSYFFFKIGFITYRVQRDLVKRLK